MNFIDQIVTHIIRPTRQLYRIGKLGPKSFLLKSKINNSVMTVNRQDFPLINQYEQKIQISHYTIEEKKGSQCPTVVYLHGNNGSRNQGSPYVRNILQNQMEVILLDFAGSGLSQGDVVTLGVKQSDDIATVLHHLKSKTKDIFLWGRSMGAVAALIYLCDYPTNVKGVIVDSPFSTLRNLIKQLASTKTGLPQFFFQAVLPFVDKQFQSKTGVTFDDLEIANLVSNIKECPALFITSENDQMVKYTHTQAIFKNYQAPKQIQYIKQEHHEVRNKQVVQKIIDFFKRNSSTKDYTVIKQYESAQNLTSMQKIPYQSSVNIKSISPSPNHKVNPIMSQSIQSTPSIPYHQTARENNFTRTPQTNIKNQRQNTNSSGKKIRSVLIQHPGERINSTLAYYQQPQKVSMAYLNKLKPKKDTFFYRQESNSMEKNSGVRSYSSQYRVSGVNRNFSQTPRNLHSKSVIKYLSQEDSHSRTSTQSTKYISRR